MISLPSFETVFVNRDKGAYELAKRPVRPTMPSVLEKRFRDLSDSKVGCSNHPRSTIEIAEDAQ